MGFDDTRASADAIAQIRRTIGVEGEFLLFFGRKEEGKNLPLLLEGFAACTQAGRGLSLVVAGDGTLPPEARRPGVIDLPRLSEEDKRAACAAALALCQPSTNESFSIVLMESWLEGTPVLVHADCPVTRRHARVSGGGLWFRGRRELVACAEWLLGHREEARAMGAAGRRYVLEEYSWPAVARRFEQAVDRLLPSREQRE